MEQKRHLTTYIERWSRCGQNHAYCLSVLYVLSVPDCLSLNSGGSLCPQLCHRRCFPRFGGIRWEPTLRGLILRVMVTETLDSTVLQVYCLYVLSVVQQTPPVSQSALLSSSGLRTLLLPRDSTHQTTDIATGNGGNMVYISGVQQAPPGTDGVQQVEALLMAYNSSGAQQWVVHYG